MWIKIGLILIKGGISMERESNLKISGAGSSGGGRFNEVKISGAGSINGDIECNVFRSSGASDVKGNIKTKIFETSGAAEIKGNIEASEIRISGAGNIKGDVSTTKIKISGAGNIGGSLHAEAVEVSGSVGIGNDCEAENFKASGGFKIGGLLNAGIIDININGKCNAKEIGGERITITRYGKGRVVNGVFKAIKEMFNIREYLVTEAIEGDDIYLESTVSKVVRGNNVKIGPDCDIDVVEYKNDLVIDKESRVKEQRRI